MAHGVQRHVPPIDLVREIDLVGAAAIVVGAARADGEAERHGLQRPRLVAGNLEALHLRRESRCCRGRSLAPRGGCPRPAGRRGPRARRSARSRAAARRRSPNVQPRLVEPAALDAFHRERDRAAGADRVDAELVAALATRAARRRASPTPHSEPSANRLSYSTRTAAVADSRRCARSRSCRPRSSRASWRASAAAASGEMSTASSNVPLWKLRVGSAPKPIERQQIRRRAQLAVLRGRRTERSLSTGRWLSSRQRRRVRPLDALRRRARRSP